MANITLSPSATFAATLAAVNTAAGGLGAAVADMLGVGHAEYLDFEQFRLTVKAGLTPDAWSTVSSYMAPMRRAWENGKVTEFVELARTKGIKAARDAFKAGEGKRGAQKAPETPETPETPEARIVDSTGDAIATATAKADEAIRAAAADMLIADLQAENAALQAENAALRAELASIKAQPVKPAKSVKSAKLKAAA